MARVKHPGCARCRMDLIRFVKETKLPRFTMAVGETWLLPQSHYVDDGSGDAHLGTGIAPAGSFVVVESDHERACHNGQRCPGATNGDR